MAGGQPGREGPVGDPDPAAWGRTAERRVHGGGHRGRQGRLAARTLIEVSGWERERLSERTQNGLRAARLNGRRAVADDPELRGRIARMRAQGMTLQAIADRLNEEGVPTLRGGQKWRPSSVQAAVGYRRPPRRWDGNGGRSQGRKGGRE